MAELYRVRGKHDKALEHFNEAHRLSKTEREKEDVSQERWGVFTERVTTPCVKWYSFKKVKKAGEFLGVVEEFLKLREKEERDLEPDEVWSIFNNLSEVERILA